MSSTVNLDENNGGALTLTASTFLALTYISVSLRVYVRGWLTKSFLADDWLMLVAQVNFTVSCTFILIGVPAGIGRHNKALAQRQEIEGLKWQALATASYVSNMLFIKLSIAVFLLRLSGEKKYKYAIWISAIIVFIWSTVLFFWNIFQCSPVEAQWDYSIPGKQCVSSEQVVSAALALSAMTILSDFFYALLPVPIIWKVKMSTQAKATVITILGLGVFASIATLVRLKFLADLNDTADILFAGTDAMVWTLIEPGVAIMASSLATIRPLLRKLRLPGFTSSANTGRSGPTGYGRSKSATNRSGTNRSNGGGRMPGFGAADLQLDDLEAARGAVATGQQPQYESKGVLVTKTTTVTSVISPIAPAAPSPLPQGRTREQQRITSEAKSRSGHNREESSDSESTRGLASHSASTLVSETYVIEGAMVGEPRPPPPPTPPKDTPGRLSHLPNTTPEMQQQQRQPSGSQPPQIPKIDVDFRHGSWPAPVIQGGGRPDPGRPSSRRGAERT